jgi:hypothetical protein
MVLLLPNLLIVAHLSWAAGEVFKFSAVAVDASSWSPKQSVPAQ